MSGLAEDDIVEAAWKRYARFGVLAVLGLGLVAGLVYLVQGLGGEVKRPARQVTRITIIPDTPPPPPPKEQPKPEPPKAETKPMKVDQPKPVDAPKPEPDQQLKMEGEAGDGPSPFASGEVTQEYSGGDIGSGNGLQFSFYTNLLQQRIQANLQRNRDLKRVDFRIVMKVWLDSTGALTRSELVGTTGTAQTDEELRRAMNAMPRVGEPPPSNMPQPITLRITNRVTG